MSCSEDCLLRCLIRTFEVCRSVLKVESPPFSRWIPWMPVVGRSVGPPVIWRKEAEKRVEGGEAFFPAELRMKIVGFAIPVPQWWMPHGGKRRLLLSENGSELAAPGAVIAWWLASTFASLWTDSNEGERSKRERQANRESTYCPAGKRGRSCWKKERNIIARHECGSELLDTKRSRVFRVRVCKVTRRDLEDKYVLRHTYASPGIACARRTRRSRH